MMKRLTLCLLCFCGLFVAPAATLYDNGTYNGLGGNGKGDAWQADDFVLAAASNLTGITFWTLEAQGAYLGSITWEIRTNNVDQPGTLVSGGSGNGAPTRAAVGTALGMDVYQNDLTVNITNLAAGTYWLVLHDGLATDVDFQDFYFAWTDLNGTNTPTNRGREQVLPGGVTWDLNDQEHAFLISGTASTAPPGGDIPEPGSVVLLSGGLAAMLCARRYAKR